MGVGLVVLVAGLRGWMEEKGGRGCGRTGALEGVGPGEGGRSGPHVFVGG